MCKCPIGWITAHQVGCGPETGFAEVGARAVFHSTAFPPSGFPDRVAGSGQSILAITSGFPVTHPNSESRSR